MARSQKAEACIDRSRISPVMEGPALALKWAALLEEFEGCRRKMNAGLGISSD